MRRLTKGDLYHGIHVKCGDGITFSEFVYKILIIDGKYYYCDPNISWKIAADLIDCWWETPETIKMNRESKIESICPE